MDGEADVPTIAKSNGLPEQVYVMDTPDGKSWFQSSKKESMENNVRERHKLGKGPLVVGVYELVRVVRAEVVPEHVRLTPLVRTEGPVEKGSDVPPDRRQ